ncbi:hypothetical protein G6F22_021562 [Rhizopus arrhizus]|nr:hypothetical protein G6F22_021562 [Rhizopus arrhizus]
MHQVAGRFVVARGEFWSGNTRMAMDRDEITLGNITARQPFAGSYVNYVPVIGIDNDGADLRIDPVSLLGDTVSNSQHESLHALTLERGFLEKADGSRLANDGVSRSTL